jgi:hypothetical protein
MLPAGSGEGGWKLMHLLPKVKESDRSGLAAVYMGNAFQCVIGDYLTFLSSSPVSLPIAEKIAGLIGLGRVKGHIPPSLLITHVADRKRTHNISDCMY